MPASTRSSPMHALAGVLLLAAAVPCLAVKGIKPDGSLDKPAISKAYFEGEFWTVINALEAFRKSGMTAHREDSIYTFKYLSVVYAAEPASRLKAESYMYQLIRMMPTIDLLDLYISDNIHSIFLKVKSDYERIERSKAAATKPPSAAPSAAGGRGPAKKKSSMRIWAPLALGGAGLATAAYFLVSLEGEEADGRTPRPVDISVAWPKEGSR